MTAPPVRAIRPVRAPFPAWTVCLVKLGPGISFSWKRATGVSAAKRALGKATGIPSTRSGRRSKLGRLLRMR